MAAVQQPVGEQNAEERHEEGAEQEQELLVLGQVDHERDPGCQRGDADDQCPLRRARHDVLDRDGGRVDVRERLVGLVHREREQGDHAADPAGGDRRQYRSRPVDLGVREHEDRAEAELEERRQEIADPDAEEGGPSGA